MRKEPESTIVNEDMIIRTAMNHDRLIRNIESSMKVEDIISDLNELRDYCILNPESYKDLKSKFLHEDMQGAGIITDIFNKGYDRNSNVFNTIIRCNNDLRISTEAIKRKKIDQLPPAFDKRMLSPLVGYNEIIELIKSRKIKPVNRIIERIRKEFNDANDEDGYDIILTNGSTTGIQDEGINILDINSICYQAPEWFLKEFNYLISELGINNFNRKSLDCPLDEDSVIAGDILHIPDKEFKIRSIYRMYWFVQVVSKRIHHKLDRVAKGIDGNFTYEHRKWLYDIIGNGYNHDKYILTTDMTKYSDTLLNDFIFEVLSIAIDDQELVNQMKRLYTLPVRDSINGSIYKEPLGTYQGQYGDFPMITIINCILQRVVYYLSGQELKTGYLAAVGDDTGFIFDKYDANIMDIVIEVYGKVGVKINTDKTHELIYGEGFGDFVKIEIAGDGLVDFFNISNAYKNNIDGFIREIYDSYLIHRNIDLMESDFIQAFGQDVGEHLTNLSFINGGVLWKVIDENDILLFKKKLSVIQTLSSRHGDELRVWYDFFKSTLLDNNVDVKDTPLIGWFEKDTYYRWCEETRNMSVSDFIEGRIFNTNLIGHDPLLSTICIDDLLGIDLGEIKSKLDENRHIEPKIYSLLNLINSYENKESLRRRRSKIKNISSYITSYALTTMDATLNNYLPTGIYIRNHDEYQSKLDIYTRRRNQRNIGSIPGVEVDGPYWGNYYLRWIHDGVKYDIERLSYSKYPRPSQELWCSITDTDEIFYHDMINGV